MCVLCNISSKILVCFRNPNEQQTKSYENKMVTTRMQEEVELCVGHLVKMV